MSIWTSVEGYVTFRRECGMSLKTMIVESFQEADPKITQQHGHLTDTVTVRFTFCFSDSNLYAAKTIQKFVDDIKSFDSSAYVDIEANIRFVS